MTNENLSVYDRICRTRKSGRATASDYINATITDFVELHGDRCFADDHAIVGGIGRLNGKPVTVIGIEKGRDLNERLLRNFGCVLPEGYRKALRLIKQAEKFHRPVICFVDTQGANCGKGAEERGQGQAIANNLYELTDVKTPIISVMIGEGGSGGALALAVADEVWMLENAYYSVITPESCASILFKDPKRAPEAAEHLKLTAADLNKMGIVEKVVEEPEDFSEEKETSHFMKKLADDLSKEIKQLEKKPVDKLLDDRYEKYRKIGRYSEYSEAVGEVPGAAQLLGVSQAPARKRRGLFGVAKILVLNGSPHKSASTTMAVTNAFVKGMCEGGEYESEIINISDLNVTPCMGCLSCWARTEGECVIKNDDMPAVKKRIEEADIIIESYPLYFFGMPGQMKLFTDRLLSMMCTYRGQKPPENGESFHGIRNPKTGQKLVLISGCAYSESESVYDSLLKEYECICGKNGFTAILCPQLKTLIELGASSRLDRYLSKYEAAGKEFAATKHLSEETKQKLSKAPFSEAVYKNLLDNFWHEQKEDEI